MIRRTPTVEEFQRMTDRVRSAALALAIEEERRLIEHRARIAAQRAADRHRAEQHRLNMAAAQVAHDAARAYWPDTDDDRRERRAVLSTCNPYKRPRRAAA